MRLHHVRCWPPLLPLLLYRLKWLRPLLCWRSMRLRHMSCRTLLLLPRVLLLLYRQLKLLLLLVLPRLLLMPCRHDCVH